VKYQPCSWAFKNIANLVISILFGCTNGIIASAFRLQEYKSKYSYWDILVWDFLVWGAARYLSAHNEHNILVSWQSMQLPLSPNCSNWFGTIKHGHQDLKSLYSLIWDFLLSIIYIWTTTTWSNVWVVLPKPSWYEFLIGFLIWTPSSKYLHLKTFSNIFVILSMFLYQ